MEELTIENSQELLKANLEHYGPIFQMDMCIEEMAELIQAINKVKRKFRPAIAERLTFIHNPEYINAMDINQALTYYGLCSEIADVKITLAQLEMIFSKEAVDLALSRKLARLKENLDKNKTA